MAPPKLDRLKISVQDGIALIKYDIPKANQLNTDGMSDLRKAFTWVENAPEVKVAVLSGEGRFFCTGMDVTGLPKDGPVLPDENIEILRQIHKSWINSSKILIAAVNGPAVGYGTSSIALFDLVYSVPDAVFFTPFAKLGLCAEACSSVTFTRALGRQKAASLLIAGDRMTAAELESAGLITKILPAEGFLEEVMKIARRVADQPPGALRANKNLMMEPMRQELLTANDHECAELRERSKTTEPREAMAAFEREQKGRKSAAKL